MKNLIGLLWIISGIAIFICIVLKIWIYSDLLDKIFNTSIVFFIGLFLFYWAVFYKK